MISKYEELVGRFAVQEKEWMYLRTWSA
jgi:hypothetical protein